MERAMTLEKRRRLFWFAVAAAALATVVLLHQILTPFLLALMLAYLLAPVLTRLERIGINRSASAVILVLALMVSSLTLFVVMIPAIIGELRFFMDEFPRYIVRIQALAADGSRPWLRKIVGPEFHAEHSAVTKMVTMSGAWADDLLGYVWSGTQGVVSLLSLLVVTPVLAIYFLIGWERMIAAVDGWVPSGHRDSTQRLAREINDTVSGFVRGQILICLILAAFYATALKFTGLNHAFLIGITAGLISFVPYLGAGAGFVVAMCVAVAQFWPNGTPLAVVGCTFLVGETLADYVLSPRIIGSRVKLNPVWLMFALFAFGWLFGFVGLLVAIPLAAALGVILRFARRKSLASPGVDVVPTLSASG